MSDTPDPTIRDVIKLLNDNHERLLHRFTTLESELRDVRAEQKGIRTYIGARAGETEMLITRSFDRLNDRMDRV